MADERKYKEPYPTTAPSWPEECVRRTELVELKEYIEYLREYMLDLANHTPIGWVPHRFENWRAMRR